LPRLLPGDADLSAVFSLVARVDGLVQRDLRRWGGDRGSALGRPRDG
jgi:hypothetical protein